MSATLEQEKPALPEWMKGWTNEKDTLEILRKLHPKLHVTTLWRMRQRGDIKATKFAGRWFYKAESAMPQPEQE